MIFTIFIQIQSYPSSSHPTCHCHTRLTFRCTPSGWRTADIFLHTPVTVSSFSLSINRPFKFPVEKKAFYPSLSPAKGAQKCRNFRPNAQPSLSRRFRAASALQSKKQRSQSWRPRPNCQHPQGTLFFLAVLERRTKMAAHLLQSSPCERTAEQQ